MSNRNLGNNIFKWKNIRNSLKIKNRTEIPTINISSHCHNDYQAICIKRKMKTRRYKAVLSGNKMTVYTKLNKIYRKFIIEINECLAR